MRSITGALAVGLWVGGCAGEPDLPSGWETAERVEGLVQAPCSGGFGPDEPAEAMSLSAQAGALALAYEHAHFRCEQPVEAYVRKSAGALAFLVQPVDMDPGSLAACDCRYDLGLTLPVARGSYEVTLYRRWDNITQPNQPRQIGRTSAVAVD